MSRAQSIIYPSCAAITVAFSVSGSVVHQPVLVDSGADANFMDINIARKFGLKSVPLQGQFRATSLDGSLLWEVTHQPTPITMHLNSNHCEEIIFEYNSPVQLVILGYPLLKKT